jgi:hypothetical protein
MREFEPHHVTGFAAVFFSLTQNLFTHIVVLLRFKIS